MNRNGLVASATLVKGNERAVVRKPLDELDDIADRRPDKATFESGLVDELVH